MTSEFGRGFATCLFQFVMHEPRLEEDLEIYRKMAEVPDGRLFTPQRAVEIWANGAADHLRDLVCGGRVAKKHREIANHLVDEAWDAGHGFNRTYGPDQARAWIATARGLLASVGDPSTLEEATGIDLKLGLRPELGITCAVPMQRRDTDPVPALSEWQG